MLNYKIIFNNKNINKNSIIYLLNFIIKKEDILNEFNIIVKYKIVKKII